MGRLGTRPRSHELAGAVANERAGRGEARRALGRVTCPDHLLFGVQAQARAIAAAARQPEEHPHEEPGLNLSEYRRPAKDGEPLQTEIAPSSLEGGALQRRSA